MIKMLSLKDNFSSRYIINKESRRMSFQNKEDFQTMFFHDPDVELIRKTKTFFIQRKI